MEKKCNKNSIRERLKIIHSIPNLLDNSYEEKDECLEKGVSIHLKCKYFLLETMKFYATYRQDFFSIYLIKFILSLLLNFYGVH